MALHHEHITLDCADPSRLATFWASALDRSVDEGASEFFASIGKAAPDGQIAYLFLAVPEARVAKNRMHLDFHSSDRSVDVERLVSLGATKLGDKDEWGTKWTVMEDPEGNVFCVAAV